MAVSVATPAFASSMSTTGFTQVAGTAEKWSNAKEKHVAWDLVLVNGPVDIDRLVLTFTYVPTSTGPFTAFEIYDHSPTTPTTRTWDVPAIRVPTNTLTVPRVGGIPANATRQIHTDFAGGDNAAGTVTAQAAITYLGSIAPVILSVGPVSWIPGNQHTHSV